MVAGPNRVILYAPVVLDIALLICLFAWLGIVVNPYETNREHCAKLFDHYGEYTYYDYNNYGDYVEVTQTCINVTYCYNDPNCDMYREDYGYSRYGCYDDYEKCTDNKCECKPSFEIYAIMLTFVVPFSLVLVIELLKGFIVLCSVINGQCWWCEASPNGCNDTNIVKRSCCCDSKDDPVQKSCIPQVADAWALLCLYAFNKKRYEDLVTASEEGKLPVCTGMRVAEVMARDILMVASLSIAYAFTYPNGLFYAYLVLVLLQWFCLRQRAQYERSIRIRRGEEPGISLQVAQHLPAPVPMYNYYVPQQPNRMNEEPVIVYQPVSGAQIATTNQVVNQIPNQVQNQQMVKSSEHGESS